MSPQYHVKFKKPFSTQCLTALCPRLPSGPVPKETFTHSHPSWSSDINFLNLLRSIASSLFNPVSNICTSQGTVVTFLRCGGQEQNHSCESILDPFYQKQSKSVYFQKIQDGLFLCEQWNIANIVHSPLTILILTGGLHVLYCRMRAIEEKLKFIKPKQYRK